jgi:hypothetical protein
MGPAVRSGDCRHRAVGFRHFDLHAGSDHLVRGVVTDECTGDHDGRGLRSTTTPMEWWACASTLHIGPSRCARVLAGRAVTFVRRTASTETVAAKVD